MLLFNVGLGMGVAAGLLAAELSRQPYIQNVAENRATIVWTTTGGAGAGMVTCLAPGGASVAAGSSVREFLPSQTGMSAPYYQHESEILKLSAGAEYVCRVSIDGAAAGPEIRFRTAGGGPLRVLAFGDSGDGAPAQSTLAQKMIAESADLVLHTGDLAYQNGSFQQFEDYYFGVYGSLMRRSPFYPVPGNHDYATGQAAAYRADHVLPVSGVPVSGRNLYYSFDWGNVHFVALDTNISLINAVAGTGPMLDWLATDLSRNRQRWTVVYLHHTPFPTSHHAGDPTCGLVRLHVTPILERHGVQLVLAGHEHNYQRAKPHNGDFSDVGPGTIYVVTGGGGAVLHPVASNPILAAAVTESHYLRMEVSGPAMKAEAVRPDGTAIDTFSLSAAPQVGPLPARDAAAFGAAVAPGGLVSIFGWNLASGEETAKGLPYPGSLAGAELSYGAKPLPLLYASRTQINAQLPFGERAGQSLLLRTALGQVSMPLQWQETAPAIFQVAAEGARVPAITHRDGSLVSRQSPAAAGEWLTVYLTGLGAVDGPISAGEAAPAAPLLRATAKVRAVVGATDADVLFAGLTPGYAGLYQVNFRVPASPGTPSTVRIATGSASSDAVPLALR